MKLATPKGFRDFLPENAVKRKFVLDKIVKTFGRFGFDPLETPTLEYAETLKGKYGEEEKLIYEFETKGGDQVALRYDQTVPTSRVAAQYGPNGSQQLPMPFRRYQIQPAFRGENTQKGRYREFLQCDADIIGCSSLSADAEILALLLEIYQDLGLEVVLAVNDRKLLDGIEPKYLSAMDKLDKIGADGVKKELVEKGLPANEADKLYDQITNAPESDDLKTIRRFFTDMGYPDDKLIFNPSIIRGLNYYTGMIVEVRLKDSLTSLAGGGRYDQLIGKFTGKDLAATGFAIGFDRTLEAMEDAGVLPELSTGTKVLVTVFSADLEQASMAVAKILRSDGVSTELWLEANDKLDKQLKYADQKGIPYVVIIGPEEVQAKTAVLKNLKQHTQETLSLDQLVAKLQ